MLAERALPQGNMRPEDKASHVEACWVSLARASVQRVKLKHLWLWASQLAVQGSASHPRREGQCGLPA